MSKKAKDTIIEVTLWSKEPTRYYMPVTIEIVALIDHDATFVLLTRPDGMAMGLNLTVQGTEQLGKDLLMISKRFKHAEKDKEWLHK